MITMNDHGLEKHTEIYHPAFLDASIWKAKQDSEMTYEQATSLVQKGFVAAVLKREMADVPSGVLLSGGLDSSVVAAVMSQHRKGKKHYTSRSQMK
jgi:asparagine synthetase B (glutamine-hydrolysing)